MSECIICLRTFESEPFRDPEYFTSVFDGFCCLLKINLMDHMRWMFEQEDIPFCQVCFSSVNRLKGLNDQLKVIENEISSILQETKDKILASGVSPNISNGDDRVTYIRHEAVKGIEIVENPLNENETTTKEDSDVMLKVEIEEEESDEKTLSFLDHLESDSEPEEIEEFETFDDSNDDDYIETTCIYETSLSAAAVKTNSDLLPMQSEASVESGESSGKKSEIRVLDSADNIHRCLHCEKSFPKKLSLQIHARTHLKPQPTLQCNVCGKTFLTTTKLNRHKKNHSEEKPYECDTCEKRFAIKDRLVKHKRTHSEERPFKCDMCEKSYNRQDGLVKHKRVHSGEKPYKCPECGVCFSRLTTLNDHKMVHSSNRPYNCDECPKKYKRQRQLRIHELSHKRGKEPFRCDACNKGFWRSSNLNTHRRQPKCKKKCETMLSRAEPY